MNGERRPFTITQVRRVDGIWHARITVDGKGTDVDRNFGSWRITPDDPRGKYSLVNVEVALALQTKIGPIERAERVENEKREKQGLEPLSKLDWPQSETADAESPEICGEDCDGLTPCVREPGHPPPHQDHTSYVISPDERAEGIVAARKQPEPEPTPAAALAADNQATRAAALGVVIG